VATAEVGPIAVAEFDSAPPADAAAELVPCCASKRWVSALVAGRPYRRLEQLTAASDAVLKRLDWRDVTEAASAQPRLSDAAAIAYEERFGHVFVICLAGLTPDAVLTSLRSRLRNDPVAEREVVRCELTKIVRLQLAKAFR
jgi:2-oxo-4-hydroxy-4-carboxy-5-ureidoimidazoline decarboxylase